MNEWYLLSLGGYLEIGARNTSSMGLGLEQERDKIRLFLFLFYSCMWGLCFRGKELGVCRRSPNGGRS